MECRFLRTKVSGGTELTGPVSLAIGVTQKDSFPLKRNTVWFQIMLGLLWGTKNHCVSVVSFLPPRLNLGLFGLGGLSWPDFLALGVPAHLELPSLCRAACCLY